MVALRRKRPRGARFAARTVTVSGRSASAARGLLKVGKQQFVCALGRGGRRPRKREGDGATPIGDWPVVEVRYRPDRVRRPRTGFRVTPIRPGDGWCDEPTDRNYNRPVRLPYGGRAERLWRDDALYDVVVVLGYNARPRIQGRGSAIFLHCVKAGYQPTEGCVALPRPQLLRILERLGSRARLRVRP